MARPNQTDLPLYEHDFEIWLEHDEGVTVPQRLHVMLTCLFQYMRVGTVTNVTEGLAGGGRRLGITLLTSCPPHDLGECEVHVRITNSRLVEPPPS